MPYRDGTCTRCAAQDEVWSCGDQEDFDDALCHDCLRDDERDADAEERQRAELGESAHDFGVYLDEMDWQQRDRMSNAELAEFRAQRRKDGDV